jgi:hypothetical protein
VYVLYGVFGAESTSFWGFLTLFLLFFSNIA